MEIIRNRSRAKKKRRRWGRRPPSSIKQAAFSPCLRNSLGLICVLVERMQEHVCSGLGGRGRQARERAVAKKPFRIFLVPNQGGEGGGRDGFLLFFSLSPQSPIRSYRGMSTPAASQAAMTLAPLGIVTVFPLTVHSIPSTTGAGAGVEASERAKKKSMPPLLSLLQLLKLLLKPELPLLPLVLAAAPPSARAAARRAAARAARSIFLKG